MGMPRGPNDANPDVAQPAAEPPPGAQFGLTSPRRPVPSSYSTLMGMPVPSTNRAEPHVVPRSVDPTLVPPPKVPSQVSTLLGVPAPSGPSRPGYDIPTVAQDSTSEARGAASAPAPNGAAPPVAQPTTVAPQPLKLSPDVQFAANHVAKHGPTHVDDLARAFALHIGKNRAGKLIKQRLATATRLAARLDLLQIREDFMWPPPGVWSASDAPPAQVGKVLYRIPPQQVANAACEVMHLGLPETFDALVADTIRTLGFKRVEKKSRQHVERVLRDLEIDKDFDRQSGVPNPPATPAVGVQLPSTQDAEQPSGTASQQPALREPAIATGASPSNLPAPHSALISAARALCADESSRDQMSAVLGLLLRGSGRASGDEVARQGNVQSYRVAGLVAKLSELLNARDRGVLTYNYATKEAVLEVEQLRLSLGLR